MQNEGWQNTICQPSDYFVDFLQIFDCHSGNKENTSLPMMNGGEVSWCYHV